MIEITPALLCKKYSDIVSGIEAVQGLTNLIQIDIIDGQFVPNRTWPYLPEDKNQFEKLVNQQESLPFWDKIDYEFDLMISAPEEKIDEFASLGPARIVIHLESVKNYSKLLDRMNHYQGFINFGLSFDDDLEVTEIKNISDFDYVQLMGIDEIGKQGNPPEPRVHYNLKYLRSKFPDLHLSVDGGVNSSTAINLIQSGANRLVIGSAIFNSESSPTISLQNFLDLVK